jgi:hypothetical protein
VSEPVSAPRIDPDLDARAEAIVEELCQQIGLAAFRKVYAALHRVLAFHSGIDTEYFARGIMAVSANHATENPDGAGGGFQRQVRGPAQ